MKQTTYDAELTLKIHQAVVRPPVSTALAGCPLKRRQPTGRSDLIMLLSRLMKYVRRISTRQSGQAREAMYADMFKRASSAHRHRAGVAVVSRSLLTEPRAPGSEKPW